MKIAKQAIKWRLKVAILASKSIYIKFWHRVCRCAKSLDSLMFVERDLISRSSAFRAFNFYEKTQKETRRLV